MKAFRLFRVFTLFALLAGINFAFASTTPPSATAINPTGIPITPDVKDGSGKNPFSINFTIGFPSGISDKNTSTPPPLAPRDTNLLSSEESKSKARIYEYGANAELGTTPARHHTNAAIKQAMNLDVDLVYIHLNAFADFDGAATDIRNKLSEFNKPMTVFIDNASTGNGAIISMRADSSDKSEHPGQIQTSVYNLSGNQFQEKYKTYVNAIVKKADKEKAQKSSFVSSQNPVCESQNGSDHPAGTNVSVHGNLSQNNIVLYNYRPSLFEKALDFLLQPFISFALICIIGLGLLFELRQPGSGFPLFASIGSSLLFFIPLYIDGFADIREIFLFLTGLMLVLCRWIWPNKSVVLLSAGLGISAVGLAFCLTPSFLIPSDNTGGWRLILKHLLLVGSAFLSTGVFYHFTNKYKPIRTATDSESEQNDLNPDLQTLRSSG